MVGSNSKERKSFDLGGMGGGGGGAAAAAAAAAAGDCDGGGGGGVGIIENDSVAWGRSVIDTNAANSASPREDGMII